MYTYFHRSIESSIKAQLARGKSIILLGPRQTGKTTVLKKILDVDFDFNLIVPGTRQQFEKRPDDLIDMVEGFLAFNHKKPLIFIDEIQRVSKLMDVIQYLIDGDKAQFVLTGSSARQLKHGQKQPLNLLPGRLVYLQMDALSISELASPAKSLQNLILDGMLPGVYKETEVNNIELDLKTYVEVYLEEEVRLEGLVRNLSVFARFLELAALSLGEPVNFTSISKQIGVSIHLIIDYFKILEDCMIAWRLEALSEGGTRRRLTKAPKYLFLDMGVRRFCAREGRQYSERELGKLFEQFVGIELMKIIHQDFTQAQLKYWRDHNGPEVDYVLDIAHQYLPIEVKLTEHPTIADCKHLLKFMAEYHCFEMAYIICRCKSPRRLKENIIALPWQDLPKIKALLQTRSD